MSNNAADRNDEWLNIARGLLDQPTAAVKEDLPQAYVRAFVKARKARLKLHTDPSGNLLVKYSAGSSRRAPLVLVAHLDHPGFWIEKAEGSQVQLLFKGWVNAPHAVVGSRVCFFTQKSAQPTGSGKLVSVGSENGRLASAVAELTGGQAHPSGFAMWDFPGFSIENGLIVTRCCDDLLGAAAALCTLDEIVRRKPKGVALWVLFTRAEEVGFLGALEAIRHKIIPRKACVLSLECSKAFDHAPQGGGVIVRVGDRSSIFDPNLTEALCQAARAAAGVIPNFRFQRKLMDGGSCEATAFCAHGYRSSGLAVPLGNYHNQAFAADGSPCMGPESVKVGDFLSEVQLLIHLALHPELLDAEKVKRPAWLDEYAREARKELYVKRSSDR